MAKQATTGTPVKHIETTQDAIIARGIEVHEDAFRAVSDALAETGEEVSEGLDKLVTGVKTPLSAIKALRSRMSSLAIDLEGAIDELDVITKEAEAQATPVLRCSACELAAEYMAPQKDSQGHIAWMPICKHHAIGWWDGADWVGKMFKIGEGIVEPQEKPGRLTP